MLHRILRFLFYKVLVKFVVLIVVGLNVRRRDKLPKKGPAIIVANHNSHLDTMVLMTLIPWRLLPIVQPVAAADYFLRNSKLAWFALNIVGILPIVRKRQDPNEDPLAPCYDALAAGRILIFFPEGSRGEPEQRSDFKAGIAKLSERFPDVPITPVLLHGLGKALPKGEALLVPFFCDVFVDDAIRWNGGRESFMQLLLHRMDRMSEDAGFSSWE